MTPELIGLIGIIALVVLLFARMWIGFAMAFVGFAGLIALNGLDKAGIVLATMPFARVNFYPMSVLPLFVLMGVVVGAAGVSGDLYNSAYKWLGRLPGGLAISTVFAAGGFAAISGSSTATAVTIGKVSLPEMARFKYDNSLATGTVAAGGTLGILIPPSLGFILYAILTEQSVGQLFMAGILPGILQILFYSAVILIICTRNPALGPRGPKLSLLEKIKSLKGVWPVMVLFLLVIGGIYGGIFTPTEAGAIGAFGAIVIVLVMRRMNLHGVMAATMESVQISGMLLILMVSAFIFANFLATSKLPFVLADIVVGISVNPLVVLIAIIILYIILGMFLDIFSSILLTLPILYPVIIAMGFDPIWFGVIMVRMMEIGLITPPVGMNVFVMAAVTDVPLGTIFRGVLPFVVSDVVHVAVLVAFPQVSLILPNTMFGS
jgi:C4-dicarboxylate transporter DctM subunit